MELKDYLVMAQKDQEKARSYDFREEVMAFEGARDGLERYIIYKAVGIAEEDNEDVKKGKKPDKWTAYKEAQAIYAKHKDAIYVPGGEADSCDLLQKLFQELWKDKLPEGAVGGDTMNSIQTTISRLLGTKSARKMIEQYAKHPAAMTEKTAGTAGAAEFLKCAYTIGNFIPCPVGCNRPATSATKDYWDLTLYYIYCWYHDTPEYRDRHLEKLFWGDRHQDRHIENYKAWLNALADKDGDPSWDAFIEANFLQDYTEWNTRPYGRPKEFWDRHFSGSDLPQTKEQIEAFFTRATACIQARSARMVDALRDPEKRPGE